MLEVVHPPVSGVPCCGGACHGAVRRHAIPRYLAAAAAAGARGVEVRYTTYTPEQAAAAQALAARFGLAPSGGSDYHGLRKPDIALGSGRGGLCVPYAYLAGLKALAGHERV